MDESRPTGLPPAVVERWLGATVKRGRKGRRRGLVTSLRWRRGAYYALVRWYREAPTEEVRLRDLVLVEEE